MKNMLKTTFGIVLLATSISASAQKVLSKQEVKNVNRILNTLAADDMRGRSALSKDIDKAADFIATEMKNIGLTPYAEDNYRQSFHLNRITTSSALAKLNQTSLASENIISLGNQLQINWTPETKLDIVHIKAEDDFSTAFRQASKSKENTLVWVDSTHGNYFKRFAKMLATARFIKNDDNSNNSVVYLLTDQVPTKFNIQIDKKREDFPFANVAGILPGKSKADEFVIFSGHYDHIGIIPAVEQDSIANGADDDASGISAMLALAQYYKKKNNNERTLIFIAFTAEEIGGFGSKYFSEQIDPEQVSAMINIEMIGKDSKFGPNAVYITGYSFSNLGELMQENLKKTKFKFYPDPYPKQNLFYRSDNAVLAEKGVPAHSFSTSQMDKDTFYHTVKDEVKTLDIKNIISSIEAIAIGASGIVTGKQTPTRVAKLKD